MKHVLSFIGGAILAIVGTLFHEFSEDIKSFFMEDPKVKGEWVLIHADTGATGQEKIISVMNLKLIASRFPLSEGKVSGTGVAGNYERVVTGYARDDYLVLAYRSTNATGIGTARVHTIDGRTDRYVGVVHGKDCSLQKIVECPAVLVKTHVGTDLEKQARIDHAALLAGGCIPLEAVASCKGVASNPRAGPLDPMSK